MFAPSSTKLPGYLTAQSADIDGLGSSWLSLVTPVLWQGDSYHSVGIERYIE